MGTIFIIACMAWATGTSCSMSDADRCPSGFTYQPTNETCKLIVDAATPGVSDASLPATNDGAAALAEEAEAAGGPDFGSVCTIDSECTSSTTNYCVMLPGSSSGYCSKAQCSTECPSVFKCCNCPAIGLVVCLTDADSTLAVAGFGCTCS
jgi:hypothetical protein